MTNLVIGVVRHLGQSYTDGTLRLEIHVPIEKASQLPIEYGNRVEITIQVGNMKYIAGLRATKTNRYVWVCPDIYLPTGEGCTLGRILTDAGFRPNDRVQLVVKELHITLHHEQQENKKFPGLERYRLRNDELETFHDQFNPVLKDVDIETLNLRDPDLMLRAFRDVAGIYFWVMRIGKSAYKIYVGKTKSLPRRLSDYTREFQVHAPNDYKLRFFQNFIRNCAPAAAFDLYFMKASFQGYTLDEAEAERLYQPLINERAVISDEDRTTIKQAFKKYYETVFAQKIAE